MEQRRIRRARCWVGGLALAWLGCSSTVTSAPLPVVPDAPSSDDASRDAETPPPDAADDADATPSECPPAAPRPGPCPRDRLLCAYPNGCTYVCATAGTARAYWYTSAGCFR